MTFICTPAARPMVAVPWRRSCSRIGGSPGCAALQPCPALAGAVGAPHRDGFGVEADGGLAVAGLGGVDGGGPAVLDDLPPHREGAGVEVEVVPVQPARLAAA